MLNDDAAPVEGDGSAESPLIPWRASGLASRPASPGGRAAREPPRGKAQPGAGIEAVDWAMGNGHWAMGNGHRPRVAGPPTAPQSVALQGMGRGQGTGRQTTQTEMRV